MKDQERKEEDRECRRRYEEVCRALQEASRENSCEGPDLVVVTKTIEGSRIVPLLEAGHRDFGESRVEEAEGKWRELRKSYRNVRLHMVGHLQSGKVREAVKLFDVIHSVDRERVAKGIAKETEQSGRTPGVFIQVNIGEETQKSGIVPSEVASFVPYCRDELGLAVRGLMCIPPVREPPALYFAFLCKLARENGLKELSMGMSGDYGCAVAHGATCVRIGQAIFGSSMRLIQAFS